MKKYSLILLESASNNDLVSYFKHITSDYKYDKAFLGCISEFQSKDFNDFSKKFVKNILQRAEVATENEIIDFLDEYISYIPGIYMRFKYAYCESFIRKFLEIIVKRNLYKAFDHIARIIITSNGYVNQFDEYYNAQKTIYGTLLKFKDSINVNKFIQILKTEYDFLPNVAYYKKFYTIISFRDSNMYKEIISKYGFKDITTDRAIKNGTLVLLSSRNEKYTFYNNGKCRGTYANSVYASIDHLIKSVNDAEELLNLFMVKYSAIKELIRRRKKLVKLVPIEIQNKLDSNDFHEACQGLKEMYEYFYNEDKMDIILNLSDIITMCDPDIVKVIRSFV